MVKEELFSVTAGKSTHVKNMYERYPFPKWKEWKRFSNHLEKIVKEQIYGNQDLMGYDILDAGCGTADKLLGFASSCPDANFLGIDLSERSLGIAKEKLARSGLQNVKFQQANWSDDSSSTPANRLMSWNQIF